MKYTLYPALEDGFPRRPIVVCRRFGTLYQFHLQGLDVEYEVQSDAGEIPKRIHTILKTRRKFEIRNHFNFIYTVNS